MLVTCQAASPSCARQRLESIIRGGLVIVWRCIYQLVGVLQQRLAQDVNMVFQPL